MAVKLKRKRITSTALISFTDVIFLLIIFLLISSNFITHAGVKVDLPGSSTHQNEYNKNVSLTITNDDEIYVNDHFVTWDNLVTVLKGELIDDPEQVIVIRADEDVSLKKVVKLIDYAKMSGSARFFIATEYSQQE